MTKRIQKIFALILSLCMMLGILAGCNTEGSGDQGNNGPVDAEGYEYKDVEVTISGPQGATDEWADTVQVKTMKEKFGVTLKCVPYPTDAWATKLTLMLTEDDLPDIAVSTGLSALEANKYGQEKYFLNFADYLGHMPNFAAFLEAHPDYKAYCTASDGGIYFLPTYQEDYGNNIARAFIKTSWLENVGMDYPETADELYAVLKAFKEKDANGNGDPNDEIPMMWGGTYVRTPEHSLLGTFGIYTAGATAKTYGILQVDENGKVFLADTTENYKAYLTYMNKLWKEQLIWNESYTTDINRQRELTKNDKVGIFSDASSYAAAGNGDPKDSQYYQYFAGLTSDYAKKPVLAYGPAVGGSAQVLVSALTKHPAEICRMLDWYYSDEGALFGWQGDVASYKDYKSLGIEGAEDVKVWTMRDELPEGYDSWETYRHKAQVINGAFQLRMIKETQIEAFQTAEDEVLVRFAEAGQSGWRAMMQLRINQADIEIVAGFPALLYADSVSKERIQLQNDICAYIQTTKAQFITGEKNIETDWDAFLNTLETMGLPRWMQIEQEAYLGMRVESVDEVEIIRRMSEEIYDAEEVAKCKAWIAENCKEGWDKNPDFVKASDEKKAEQWDFLAKMYCIIKDLFNGNPNLPEGREEEMVGHNAIAGGFQGQRQWTDFYPNCDFPEALLNSTFDHNGAREPYILATENDVLNGLGMLFIKLLTNRAAMFSDVRTYWSPEACERASGYKVDDGGVPGMIYKTDNGEIHSWLYVLVDEFTAYQTGVDAMQSDRCIDYNRISMELFVR